MIYFVNMQIKSAYLGSIGNIGFLQPKENASEVPRRNLAGLTGYNKKADLESLPNLKLTLNPQMIDMR